MVNKILFFTLVVIIAFLPSGIIISFVLLLIYYGKPILESLGIQSNDSQNDEYEESDWEDIQTSDPSDLDRFWHPTWGFSRPKTEFDPETLDRFR